MRAGFLVAVSCGAVFALAFLGGASARSSAQPVFKVDFRITAVGKSRPPNIVETRLAGKGTLYFDSVPKDAVTATASVATGKLVVEYDVLTPTPRTERLTIALKQANFTEDVTSTHVLVFRRIAFHGTISASSLPQCAPVGESARGDLAAEYAKKLNLYVLSVGGCDVTHGQRATIARKSVVHLSISTACLLRTTSSASAVPLCGPSEPTHATIEAQGAVRGEDLVSGALSCAPPGQKFGTGCFVNGPQNSSIAVKATIDVPLPADWSWKIDYDSGVAADQLFACPHNEEVCTATIKTPDKSQVSGVTVILKIFTPRGVTGPALGITLQ